MVTPNSRARLSLYLSIFISLLLAPWSAHSRDYADGVLSITAICPALIKRDLPAATAQETKTMCACMRDTLTASGKDYPSTLPSKQQWTELGIRAAKQCMEPYGRKTATQQCVANSAWRQQFTAKAGLSDAQFDSYCSCHANLTFDEIAKGLNPDDPQSQSILQAKSAKQCVEPLRAQLPAN